MNWRLCPLVLLAAFLAAWPSFANQPESHWEPLTEADVSQVVTTLEALIETAESGGTAVQPQDIEMSGLAAEILWAAESAVAGIDESDRRESETLHRILVANGYQTERNYVLEMWGHYAQRVLDVHDAIRLGYFERDLGGEWHALEIATRSGGSEAQIRKLTEIDRAAGIVATSVRDQSVVEKQTIRLEQLRQRIAGWPKP